MKSLWVRFLPEFIRSKIEGRDRLEQAISNTGWMMGDQVVRKGIGLLVGVLVARHFGPRLYGDLSYAIAVVVIVSPVAKLALDDIAIRRLAREPSSKEEILGTSFLMMLAGGVIAFLVAVAAIGLVRPGDRLVQWLVGILAAGCVIQAFMAIEFWFESKMQWRLTVYGKTSAFLLLSLVKLTMLFLDAPLIAFAWAGLGEIVLGSSGLVIVYRLQGLSVKAWRFCRKTAVSLLSDSWPLVLSALLTMVYLRIDQVMLGSLAGSAELGKYAVAVQLSEVWYFVPMVISSSVFPAFVEVERDNEQLFFAHLQRLYSMMALYAYCIAVPISIFSQKIVQFLFSSEYAGAAPLAAVLVWAGVFTGLGAARNVLIVTKNWTRVNLVSVTLGGVANIGLNLLLIPAHGAMGAVVATLISYWLAVHGSCFLFRPLRKTGWMMTRAMLYPKVW